jgi:hypothetical protein
MEASTSRGIGRLESGGDGDLTCQGVRAAGAGGRGKSGDVSFLIGPIPRISSPLYQEILVWGGWGESSTGPRHVYTCEELDMEDMG